MNVVAAVLSSVRDGSRQRRCCQQEVAGRSNDVAVLAGAQVYSDRSQEEQDQPGRDADVPYAQQSEQQARGPGDLERAECWEPGTRDADSGGTPDPLAAAREIRETFHRMAMNDEETLALIVGGHTFGKAHGAAGPVCVGPAPAGAPVEQQGLGWKNTHGTGSGPGTVASGIEGAWTSEPTKWDNEFLDNLLGYDWERVKSPAGAWRWIPADPAAQDAVPDAHDPSRRHPPIMLTTDIALKADPVYEPIARRFREHPDQLAEAFAAAWFKLLHRDMGPVSHYLGPWVPEPQLFQDPVPAAGHPLITEDDITALKGRLLASGLTVSQLVSTAWAAAASTRCAGPVDQAPQSARPDSRDPVLVRGGGLPRGGVRHKLRRLHVGGSAPACRRARRAGAGPATVHLPGRN